MVGAGAAGALSDRLGRRRLIIAAAVTFTVGALAAAAAPSAGALVSARFVLGLAVGSAALVVPLYLSEIAPTKIRGAIASLNQLMIGAFVFVRALVPETKGRSLEEIEASLQRKSGVRVTAGHAASQ